MLLDLLACPARYMRMRCMPQLGSSFQGTDHSANPSETHVLLKSQLLMSERCLGTVYLQLTP